MKFFERINRFFVKTPFPLYLFIVVFSIIPFLTHIVKEADKELVAERQLEEKQKVCVDTDVLIKPDLTYKIKVCSNESVELLSINGKAIAKENN